MPTPAIALTEMFANYRSWYIEHWVPKLLADYDDEEEDLVKFGWHDPISGLQPASAAEIAALELRFGPLPASYADFLRVVGTGELMIPTERWQDELLEPMTLTFTRPVDVPGAHASFLDWLHPDWYEANSGIDLARMTPIIGVAVDANFVLLSLQHPGDDRVNVWRHDLEPFRLDADATLVELLRKIIDSGKREEGLPFDI